MVSQAEGKKGILAFLRDNHALTTKGKCPSAATLKDIGLTRNDSSALNVKVDFDPSEEQ